MPCDICGCEVIDCYDCELEHALEREDKLRLQAEHWEDHDNPADARLRVRMEAWQDRRALWRREE